MRRTGWDKNWPDCWRGDLTDEGVDDGEAHRRRVGAVA